MNNPTKTEEQRRAEVAEYFRENPPMKMPSRPPNLTSEYFQMVWSKPSPPPPVQAPEPWSIEEPGKPLNEMTETELRKRAEELKVLCDAVRPKRDDRGAMPVALFVPAYSLTTIPEGAQAVYSIKGPRTSEKLKAKIQRCVSSD